MGRKRLYSNNAERQKHFQQLRKQRELQQRIEVAQNVNSNQANKSKDTFENLVAKWFYGKDLQQVKEAYEQYKKTYQSIGIDVLFQEIRHYIEDDMPLIHGITVGDIEYFLSVVEDHIPCPICGYYYSHFEKVCPECSLKIRDYAKWREYRRSVD